MRLKAAHKNQYANQLRGLKWILERTQVTENGVRTFDGHIYQQYAEQLGRLIAEGYGDPAKMTLNISWMKDGELHTITGKMSNAMFDGEMKFFISLKWVKTASKVAA